jgi:hypothetical protein
MANIKDNAVMTAAGDQPFYKNENLRRLYLMLIPGTLIVSATMGYDGSMMNGIQAVERWNVCKLCELYLLGTKNAFADLYSFVGRFRLSSRFSSRNHECNSPARRGLRYRSGGLDLRPPWSSMGHGNWRHHYDHRCCHPNREYQQWVSCLEVLGL